MKRKLSLAIYLAFFLMVHVTFSQGIQRSTLSAAGSSVRVNNGSTSYFISQSIGQSSVIGTYSNNGHTILQGFQQPIYALKGKGVHPHRLNATAFPNPVENVLKIRIAERSKENVKVLLIDNTGRVVIDRAEVVLETIDLDLSEVVPGAYILKVVKDKKIFTTVINKL